RVRKERQVRRVAELARGDDEAIPVRSERWRVLSTDVEDVLHVLDDRLEPVTAEEFRAKDDASDATFVGQRAELLVVDVTPMLERTRHTGVTDDGRARRHRARLEETFLVDVREIDDDA